MKALMDQFVCVRLVQANRLDLTKFQFDYDLTFSVFFMNSDGTVYGRYGTRSSRKEANRELSGNGLAAAMSGALTLHQNYPKNKASLAGKQSKPTKFKTPDDFPSLKGKFKPTINYEKNTSQSCLHCHQVTDAERAIFRNAGKPIPDKLLFLYPMPQVVGLSLDPKTRATVDSVADKSSAEAAGFRKGDEILTLNGQPILSIADVQWLLHHADDTDRIVAVVRRRNGSRASLKIMLNTGWRRATDISWRVSSWPLRRMGTGGLVLKSLSTKERKRANLPESQLALRVDGMGRYGPHAAARRAGFRKGDILISFNGRTKPQSVSGLLALATQTTKPGQRIPVIVLRNGKRIKLTLPMQR